MVLAIARARRVSVLVSVACTSMLVTDVAAEGCDGPLPLVTTVPLPLNPTDEAQHDVGRLRYRGGLLLQHNDPTFGAFSGMYVSPDGSRLVAVSDGKWLDATLTYSESGDLAGFKLDCFRALLDQSGQELVWWEDQDAESLTFDGEEFLVGFETNLRVSAYKDFAGPARDVALPQNFSVGVPPGAGYSAIAADRPGAFYLLTEYARNAANETKGYVNRPSGSGEVWLTARGETLWLPVELAVMPSGDLVLAEIALVQESGVSAYRRLRVSTIDEEAFVPNGRITPETIAELGPPLIREKYESIESRRGPAGETLIYVMSDDGRTRAEDTVIRMFELSMP